MPDFCANISLLFREHPFLERFDAAARAGFAGVEFHSPYRYDAAEIAAAAEEAGVQVVMFHLPAGELQTEEGGVACDPARCSEFADGLALALEYALQLRCLRLNCVAGVVPRDVSELRAIETLVANLKLAARALKPQGMALLLEPCNTRTVPGYAVPTMAVARSVLRAVGAFNLRLQYDVYHAHMMGEDLHAVLHENHGAIGHVQIADAPGRNEPGSGGIDFHRLFMQLDDQGYSGWVGAEYEPRADTASSLAWLESFR